MPEEDGRTSARVSARPSRRAPHPPDLPWPTSGWPEGPLDGAPDGSPGGAVDADTVRDVVATLMADTGRLGDTHAIVVVHRGRLVVEAYGPDTDASTRLISWSTAKSITHALVGLSVGDGLLDPSMPAPVPEWVGDERSGITLQHLLSMRDGLDFNEEYVDVGVSHVVDMLFVAGKDDVAGYAAGRPLAHPPGSVWNYSSGTTNIISRIVGDAQQDAGSSIADLLERRLLGRIGMTSAVPTYDASGTFVGSSFVHATARDFAKFGYLYLRDGVWEDVRLLPEGWVDHAGTVTAVDPDSGFGYGAQWWTWPDQAGSIAAHGYQAQYVVVLPARDLVVVRLGQTDSELRPALVAEMRRLIGAFPDTSGDAVPA